MKYFYLFTILFCVGCVNEPMISNLDEKNSEIVISKLNNYQRYESFPTVFRITDQSTGDYFYIVQSAYSSKPVAVTDIIKSKE